MVWHRRKKDKTVLSRRDHMVIKFAEEKTHTGSIKVFFKSFDVI